MNISKLLIYITLFFSLPLNQSYAKDIISSTRLLQTINLSETIKSTEGSELKLYRQHNACLAILKVYGDIGQDESIYQFKNKRLLNGVHISYLYQVAPIDLEQLSDEPSSSVMQHGEKVMVDRTPADQASLDDILRYIDTPLLTENCP